MIHKLKIWPEYYKAVRDGKKNFEVRNNDREFSFGDIVYLKEWDPKRDYKSLNPPLLGEPRGYTGSEDLKFKIGYILPIENGKVVFSLLKTSQNQTLGSEGEN